MRTGSLAYVIVGLLAVALVAVTAIVVTTSNKISDQQAEKASLEAQLAQAEAEAEAVELVRRFASVQSAREQTVSTLAQSRFDWERVLRELAIVIPRRRLAHEPERDGLTGGGVRRVQPSSEQRLLQRPGGHEEHLGALAADQGCAAVTRRWRGSSPRCTTSTGSPGSRS